MQKLFKVMIIIALAMVLAGNYYSLMSEEPKKVSDKAVEKTPQGSSDQKDKRAGKEEKNAADQGVLDLENREFEIDEKEDKRLEGEFEQEKRKFQSLRQKKNKVSFHFMFGIGGLGYGVVGDSLKSRHGLYRINYSKGSFQFGFRGGIEGLLQVDPYNSLSLGVFFEQRKPELKISYVPLTGIIIPQLDFHILYFVPAERYVSRSVVDGKYLTLPITYRYLFKEKFYFGFGVDVAILLQAETSFSLFLLGSGFNLKNIFPPVDFGGRVLFGVIMNKVFIEFAGGVGVLKLDSMSGARRSMYLTAMIGYRI